MIVVGTDVVEQYFKARAGHRGIRAARAQVDAWLVIATTANWKTPADVKKAHPKASILKSGRVVFNIKGNDYSDDYRLIVVVQYGTECRRFVFSGRTKNTTRLTLRWCDESKLDHY